MRKARQIYGLCKNDARHPAVFIDSRVLLDVVDEVCKIIMDVHMFYKFINENSGKK